MSALRVINVEPDGYSPSAREILASIGTVIDGPFTRDELVSAVRDANILVVRLAHQIDGALIGAAPKLRVIVSATTGLDHIDLQAARQRGVEVLSLQGEVDFLRTITATSEHTWALLLALKRRIVPAVLDVRQGHWERDRFRGNELQGSRLGLVGLGRIGRKVAEFGAAFGMRVAAFDPLVSEWVAGVDRAGSIDDLVRGADVLSLHVPLSDETRHLIDARVLALLPRGAVVVNTSRGEVIDEAALIEALSSGHLAGAALDTIHWERDAARRNGALLAYARSHDKLLVTPHLGGATAESMTRTEIFMAEKLARFLRKQGAA